MSNNVLDEYLIKLGATVDQSGLRRFEDALRTAAHASDLSASGIASSFFKAETAIVGGFAAIGSAALGLVDKVAMADQDFRLFALRMYMSKDAARSLKVAMDALGQPLENLAWDAELRARTHQLIEDQRAMAPEGDFEEQMRKVRDIRFEFTRMEVELQYLGMHVVQDFLRALGIGPDTLLEKLREFNSWVITHLPQISSWLASHFLPVWQDVKNVFFSVEAAAEAMGLAFTNIVGLLSGDSSIEGTSFSFDHMAAAIQKVVHWFAVFAESIANTAAAIADLIAAVAALASGNFSGAQAALGKAVQSITGGVAGGVIGGVGGGLLAGAGGMAAGASIGSAFGPAGTIVGGALGGLLAVPGAVGGFGVGSVVGNSLAGTGRQSSPSSVSVPGVTDQSWANLAAATHGIVSAELLKAVASQESGSRGMSALSSKGAIGYMQLMPETAKQYGVDPSNALQNLMGGTAYLRDLMVKYGGNVAEALGAYNVGPGRMDAFLAGKATLPSETQNYIAKVLGRTGQSGDLQVGSITIHVAGTNATPHQIQRAVSDGVIDAANRRIQRNLAEFQDPAWSY